MSRSPRSHKLRDRLGTQMNSSRGLAGWCHGASWGWGYGYSQMSQIRPERLHKVYRFVCSRDGVILRKNYQAAAIAARVDRSRDVASLVAQRNRDCAQSKHHLLVDA